VAAKVVGIEGDAPEKRVVVLEFENLNKAQAAFASAPHGENRKIGDKHAKFRIFAIECAQFR